ncbi:hypothetical protein Csa_021938 [Cucumis sativus]|nr:hypothetical protein Csa_021938 [Cucumis sativus]
MIQQILEPCDTGARLHSLDLHGRHDSDWVNYLAPQILLWEDRNNFIASVPQIKDDIYRCCACIHAMERFAQLEISSISSNAVARTVKLALRNLTSIYRLRYFECDVSDEKQGDPARHEDFPSQLDFQNQYATFRLIISPILP